MTVGQRIREARIEKSLTQEQLGELIGVQKSAVAKWENGRVVNIKRKTLEQLATFLDIPPHLLVTPESVGHQPVDSAVNAELSDDETKLLEMYRQLNPQGKEYILQTIVMATQVYTKNASAPDLESSAEGLIHGCFQLA